MPSRQERRKAERDAAKRAPAQGTAAAGAAAAAARANVGVNPLGSWNLQAEDPMVLWRALGGAVVKERSDAGDGEAQWTLGNILSEADDAEVSGFLGTACGSPGSGRRIAQVRMELCPGKFTVAHETDAVPDEHMMCLRVPFQPEKYS
jgi:hypothetical protein